MDFRRWNSKVFVLSSDRCFRSIVLDELLHVLVLLHGDLGWENMLLPIFVNKIKLVDDQFSLVVLHSQHLGKLGSLVEVHCQFSN